MSDLHVYLGAMLITYEDGSPAYGHAVPPPLWRRVLAEVARQGLTEDYRKAFERDLAEVERARDLSAWPNIGDEHAAEERLFRRVVERVYGPQARWPWERGWTQSEADAYPVARAAGVAA